MKRIFCKISCLSLAILNLVNFSVSAADFENPPSLNIEIPADSQSNPEESNSGNQNNEAPPELNINIPPDNNEDLENSDDQENTEEDEESEDDSENDEDENQDKIKIEEHEVFPRTVNLDDAKPEISYTISDDARVKISILDADEKVVVQIFNDEVDEGEHEISWNGTDTNDQSGNLVNPGKYFYQIEAINEETDRIDDTEEGEINVIANNNPTEGNENDFENSEESEENNNSENQENTGNNLDSSENLNENSSNNSNSENSVDSQAVMEMQNRQNGRSSETGPEIFIYLLIGALGFFFPLCYKK